MNSQEKFGGLGPPSDLRGPGVAEAAFEALTALAADAFDAPIALIGMLDADRRWFRACHGVQLDETPRAGAFCQMTIAADHAVLAGDAASNALLREDPLVAGPPHARAYAGAPMIGTSGRRLGALCVLDLRPRNWSEAQGQTLERLARIAASLMEAHAGTAASGGIVIPDATASLGELRYRTVFSAMREGLVLHDRTGAIVETNPSASRILGLTEDQILGRTSVDPRWRTIRPDGSTFPGPDHPAMVSLRTGQPVDDEIMGVVQPSGELRWLLVSARPLYRDDELTPFQTVATFVDITETKRAEKALSDNQQRLDLALRLGQAATWEIDYKAGAYFSAGAVQDLFGRDISAEAIEDVLALVHPDDRARVQAAWDEHAPLGQVVDVEHRLLPGGDAPPIWVRSYVTAYLGDDGQPERIVGLFKNVEARKAEERKLAQALEAAEAASAAKTRFLANTSHEIRTPLNGVIGVAGALALTDLDARQREMVDLILGSGRSLERILTDILDLSKVEAGKMELELRPFDLRTEINASAQLMSMRADDKGVGFTIDYSDTADGVFLGDAVRIRQIVSNLVSNAVKFTEAGQVSVTVDVVEAGEPGAAAWLSIAVQDSGMGFEQGDAPFLFDRFAQADDSITRRYGGTGLGLSICKALAELMGGEISAASTPGEGSRFQVDLPLARAEAPAPVERLASTVGLGGEAVRVLLVEDHPTNQKVVELLLAPFGVDLTIAENGVEALSLFGEAPFDLILMDMQMPVMDGLAATAAIRRREAAEGRVPIPICMMTANSSSEHRAQAAAAGADSFMSKPVSSQTLLGGIDDMLALAAARRGG